MRYGDPPMRNATPPPLNGDTIIFVVDIGGKANPPGFDAELKGLEAGADKQFTIHYPDDYAVKEMASTSVDYGVKVKDIRKRVLPALDDEFAKDVGEFGTLDALRDRIQQDLQREAEAEADRNLKGDLLKQSPRDSMSICLFSVEREIVGEPKSSHGDDEIRSTRGVQTRLGAVSDSQREASRESGKTRSCSTRFARRET